MPDTDFIVALGPMLAVDVYDDLIDIAHADWPANWPLAEVDFLAEGRRLGAQFR